MLSRSLSDCKSLLLNLKLNLNRCLVSVVIVVIVVIAVIVYHSSVVLWNQKVCHSLDEWQCHLLSCPGQLTIIICPCFIPLFQTHNSALYQCMFWYSELLCKVALFSFFMLSNFKRLQDGSSKPQCTAHVQSELGSLLRAGFFLFLFVGCARSYCLCLCLYSESPN